MLFWYHCSYTCFIEESGYVDELLFNNREMYLPLEETQYGKRVMIIWILIFVPVWISL